MTIKSAVNHPTLHLDATRETLIIRDGKMRIMGLAVAFLVCYLLLGIRVLEVMTADRSLLSMLNDTMQTIDSAKDTAMHNVALIRGEASTSDTRLQPSSPAMVMPRQSIYDVNGTLIASSVKTRSLYARPQEIASPTHVMKQLAAILPDGDNKRMMRRLTGKAKFVWLKRHLTPQEQKAIIWAGIPGLYLHDDYRRIYPHDRLMSHVLGYTDIDGKGLAGVEKSFNQALGYRTSMQPLHVSLDVRMQHILHHTLENAMHEYRSIAANGAIIHIPTGQVRAMVSLPDYDPNHPLKSSQKARFNQLSVGQYELGSIFKTLSLAMAMEHGDLSMKDGFDATQPIRYKGSLIRDFHPKKRWLSIPEILVYSSNIGTVKMVETIPVATQRDFLNELGMFSHTGLELSEYSIPSTRQSWKPVERATISYGHGISVTPLHLMKAMMAVTGGGQQRDLTLLKGTTKSASSIISEDTSTQVNRLMRAVVQHGTASKVDVPGYAVGAKTGTANKVIGGQYHHKKKLSSLAAAFPMPNPQYLVFVMLDEPQGTQQTFNFATAGWVAAPTAGKIIQDMTSFIAMPPIYETPQDNIDHMIVEAARRAKANKKSHYVRQTTY